MATLARVLARVLVEVVASVVCAVASPECRSRIGCVIQDARQVQLLYIHEEGRLNSDM